jgi:glycosyltransferase involved in cell wall biosynthesis
MRTRRRSTLDTPTARPAADGASLGWPVALPPVVPPEALPPQPELPRIKVLHVITRFWAGAGGNTLLSALGADPGRYDVWVAGADGGPLWEPAERAGLRTVRLRRFREVLAPVDDLAVLWQLVRLLRRERFTVVHTHSAKGGFLGRLAAWLTRVPLVVHTYHGFSYHDFMPAWRRRLYLTLERLGRPFTHAFLAVSPRVASEAVAMRLAPPGSVTVVPSAVELDQLPDRPDPRLRQELGLPAGTRLVGTVGRLDFQKAPLDFVRMAARVAAARPSVRFVMVGDGPMADEVRAEAERLGVDLALIGFRADAPVLATAFDVFVIASLYEGLGRALTEALGSGRPVVATAVNGVPDLVVPGSTGLLAPPGDPGALAESVIWLLDHPEEGRRMGGQGRALVRTLFDPALMCELIDRTYRHLLGLPDPGSHEIDLTDQAQARPVAATATAADGRAGLVAEKRGA